MNRKAIVLINVGTPDAPTKKDVGKYLRQFLNDKRVIDISLIFRFILVNLIIIPFRVKKSTNLYQAIWTDKGSPLVYHTVSLSEKLEKKMGRKYDVYPAMRYGNPNLKDVIKYVAKTDVAEVVFVPMYPQYAQSTTQTSIVYAERWIKKFNPELKFSFVKQFYNTPEFIYSFLKRIRQYDLSKYDHVLFSFHGLPLRHVQRVHPKVNESDCTCVTELPVHGKFCYKATCYETARILASRLSIGMNGYTVTFQSRLSKNWLRPFTDETLIQLAKDGKRRVLVIAPAFVTDCLETIHELGVEARDLFLKYGGKELTMVESLNDTDFWVEALTQLVDGY